MNHIRTHKETKKLYPIDGHLALTTAGLYVLALTFFTLEMWVTVIAETFAGTVWFLLFLFSVINKRKTD